MKDVLLNGAGGLSQATYCGGKSGDRAKSRVNEYSTMGRVSFLIHPLFGVLT